MNTRPTYVGHDTANFFWEGSELGPVETGCVASFVQHGFKVCVYSYRNLKLPTGVTLYDATEIMPKSDLSIYCQAGQKGNLAAFSDAFRYRLLDSKVGWWFDADMLCLDDCSRFESLLRTKRLGFCAGREDRTHINGAALFLSDRDIAGALLDDLNACGLTFDWGEIGPKLLTRVIRRLGLQESIEPPQTFYPIHYRDFEKLYDPAQREWCEENIIGSLALHLWNEIRSRLIIPSSVLPPNGSFLHTRLTTACPYLQAAPTLRIETFHRLARFPAMERRLAALEDFEVRVKGSTAYRFYRWLHKLDRSNSG